MGVTAILAVLVLVVSIFWQSHVELKNQNTQLTYLMSPANNVTDTEGTPDLGDMFTDLTSEPSDSSPREIPTVAEQLFGTYMSLKEQGVYTPERGEALGHLMAPMINARLAYRTFTEKDVVASPDSGEKAALTYQSALHDALAPLRTNTTPEFEFFGRYLESKNPSYLKELVKSQSLF